MLLLPFAWSAAPAPGDAGPDDAWLPRYDLAEEAGTRFELTAELGEVSGLATDARGRIFAHEDETSTVFELDPRDGRVLKRFHVGRKGLRGDFEGIALAGARFFLSTSDGTVFEFREAPDGEATPYRSVSTGLGKRCELEGLAYDDRTDSLLLPCKTPRDRDLRRRLTIFALPASGAEPDPHASISLPWAALESLGLDDGFHPSAVEVHPESGSLFVLSGRERAIIEVGRDGRVLAGRRLSRSSHPQPEGIGFAPDGALWIADEGGRRGFLHRYPLAPPEHGAGPERPGAPPPRSLP